MAFDAPYAELEQLKSRFSEEQLCKFRECFSLFDLDSDGVISTNEVGHVMRACGLNLTEAALKQSLDEFSGEDPTNVDFPQFLTIMARKYEVTPIDDDMEDLRNAFKVFDKEGNGYLSITDMRNIIIHLGEILTPNEADKLIRDADCNGEGLINIEEFIKLLCQR